MVLMSVWPTDGSDGSVATEARWRKMARLWLASGVIAGQGGEMAPTLAFPNLTVQAGACWVDGHYAELAGSQVLTVTAAGLAVVRFDPAANTADLLYRDAATTPTQTPGGIWEIPIALLAASTLTDRRGALLAPSPVRVFTTLTDLKASNAPIGTSASVLNDPTWQLITRYSTGWVGTRFDAYSGTTDSVGKVTLALSSFGFTSVSWVTATGSIAFGTDIASLLPFARVAGANIEIYFLKITNAGLGAYDNNKAVTVQIHLRGVLTP